MENVQVKNVRSPEKTEVWEMVSQDQLGAAARPGLVDSTIRNGGLASGNL